MHSEMSVPVEVGLSVSFISGSYGGAPETLLFFGALFRSKHSPPNLLHYRVRSTSTSLARRDDINDWT